MKKGIVPRSGIDTDARWGFSHTKRMDIWIQTAYYMSSTDPSSIIVPLSVYLTTANVPDNQVYPNLTSSSSSSLSSVIIKKTHYMVADPGYDDQKLYELSRDLGFQLVCPST